MPFSKTPAHGDTFLQAWKYTNASFVSSGRMQEKPALDAGVENLMRILDRSLAKAAARLGEVDKPAYTRMRRSHRDISKDALAHLNQLKPGMAKKQKEWFTEDPDRARTSSFRLGGIGSMLAVSISTAEGTKFHYDDDDDSMLGWARDCYCRC
jgi:hypothetical protein